MSLLKCTPTSIGSVAFLELVWVFQLNTQLVLGNLHRLCLQNVFLPGNWKEVYFFFSKKIIPTFIWGNHFILMVLLTVGYLSWKQWKYVWDRSVAMCFNISELFFLHFKIHTHCHNLNILVEHPFCLWTGNKTCNIHLYSFAVSSE